MRKLKHIIIVLALAALPATTFAQSVKIGFVNPVLLLDRAPQTKAAKEQVEREFKARDNQLVNSQKELKRLEEELKRDGSTMSTDDREVLETKVSRLRRELKRDVADLREDLSIARNRAMGELQKSIHGTIIKFAKEKEYDLIVDTALYASPQIDVTEDVLKILNKDFKDNAGK